MDTPQFYTLEELSGWSHISIQYLRKAIREGQLHAHHFGRYYVSMESWEKFIGNGAGKYDRRGRRKGSKNRESKI